MSYGLSLFEQHARMLEASGIPPEHAHSRGYVSVDTKVRLDQLGITKAGRSVPGLLVPSLRPDGSTWGYQYRPDSPRERNGKPVKYETPAGQRNGLDVPPGVGPMLADPAVPLWITEGVKKADAAAVRGLCCVALPGVWSWRGQNGKGGKTALPEWHDVALDGRRVVLAFDSDVVRKRAVRHALDQLAGYLSSKGARVEYLHLPDGDTKTGLDDYLAAGHGVAEMLRLVRPEPPAVAEPEPSPVSPDSPQSPVRGGTPLPERVTGDVLQEARDWLARFVCTVDDADLDLLALWAAHTHLAVETYTTPRLMLDSPVPGSGKTTTMEHLERLCLAPVQMAAISSSALLARILDQGMRTLLIDEADRSLSPDREGVAELLAVLNSGYKRGATRPVLTPTKDGWKVAEMPTYAPVALAGNNPNLPDDTRSRLIRVLLMPDVDGTAEESDWEWLDEDARKLGRRLAAWAEQVSARVRGTKPALPAQIKGRARERWAPLKRIAEAAGGRWPAVVDRLAVEDVERIELEMAEGIVQRKPHVILLGHIAEAWDETEPFIRTDELIDRLVAQHPEMWGELSSYGKRLTAQRLGRMLAANYRVHSGRENGSYGPRGYWRASLSAAFRRFRLTPSPETGDSGGTGETGDAQAQPAPTLEAVADTGTPTCRLCPKPLAPLLTQEGYDAHPSCLRREAS